MSARKPLDQLHPRYAKDREKNLERAKQWQKNNRERCRINARLRYYKNKDKLLVASKLYYQRNKAKCDESTRQFYLRNPWYKFWQGARSRCNTQTTFGYQYYVGKGIKCLLTKEECAALWKRDALTLKRPSLDRIDSSKDYTFDNCRFVECDVNTGRLHDRQRKFKERMRREIAIATARNAAPLA